MNIPADYSLYFVEQQENCTFVLRDDQTRLYLLFLDRMYIVKVDRGIIQNIRPGIRKCDYLIYDNGNLQTHLIELKGSIIRKAIDQICNTLDNISANQDIAFLLCPLNLLDAYIVSPGRQNIPVGIDSRVRDLARRLACLSRQRVRNIFELVKFVKVLPSQRILTDRNGHVLCSSEAPLTFPR